MARKFHSRDWRRGRWEERRFAPTVAAHLELDVRLGEGTFDPVDAHLWHKGKVSAVCEFKRRYMRRGERPTFMIEEKKLRAVLALAKQHGVLGYMAVRFDNADAIALIDPELPYKTGWGGRDDRGDPLDRQPMMYIPHEHFELMETVPYQKDDVRLLELAAEAIDRIRTTRSLKGVDRRAQEYETLTWELEESDRGLVRARAHHIRNLARYRRDQLRLKARAEY